MRLSSILASFIAFHTLSSDLLIFCAFLVLLGTLFLSLLIFLLETFLGVSNTLLVLFFGTFDVVSIDFGLVIVVQALFKANFSGSKKVFFQMSFIILFQAHIIQCFSIAQNKVSALGSQTISIDKCLSLASLIKSIQVLSLIAKANCLTSQVVVVQATNLFIANSHLFHFQSI